MDQARPKRKGSAAEIVAWLRDRLRRMRSRNGAGNFAGWIFAFIVSGAARGRPSNGSMGSAFRGVAAKSRIRSASSSSTGEGDSL